MTPEVRERIEQIRNGIVPEGYKKTAVGISPDDWRENRLSEVAEFLDDRRIPIKESERIQGAYPYYGASGVIDHVAGYIFDGEYILLGEDGANIIERSTPLAFRVSGKCWINNHAHVLSPKDGYHIDYLTNYLESLSYVKYNSGTAQPKLNQDTCQKIPVVCGSYTEQERIADILSAQDTIIELKEKQLTEKQRQKKYLMQQLLTGKKRLPGFNGKWEYVELGTLAKKQTQKNAGFAYTLVLSNSAQHGIIPQADQFDKEIACEDHIDGYYVVHNGFFVYNPRISVTAPCGPINRNETGRTGVMSPLYTVFAVESEQISKDFLKQYFQSSCWYKHMKSVANYGARHDRMSISDEDFFQMPIPVPSLEEQKTVAQILTLADQEIGLLRSNLEQEKKKKKALMLLLLTGIVRV